MKNAPFEVRFWAKVNKTDFCWLWSASKFKTGYGQFGAGKYAHRIAYEMIVGPIPEGMVIDHLCRVRHCVNPDHLEPVSNKTNLLRGVGFSGVNSRKTHCSKGHPFDEQNTYYSAKGYRACRTCHRISVRDAKRLEALERPPRQPITHCKRGHEFTLDNTRIRKNGTRLCRTCNAIYELSRPSRDHRKIGTY